jgi:hypothetical protein
MIVYRWKNGISRNFIRNLLSFQWFEPEMMGTFHTVTLKQACSVVLSPSVSFGCRIADVRHRVARIKRECTWRGL